MTFAQFLAVLKARWWVAAIVLALTVATTLAVSLLLPKRYTASAAVVIDMKPDPLAAVMYAGVNPAIMATQVDIIQSDRVALRVVRNLKLAENPQVRAQWQEETHGEGTIEQWLSDSFQRALDVKPSRESSVITVSYSAPDPRFAAGLTNAFVQAYIDTALELRVDPARLYSNFFDTRSKDARDALEKAQSRLSAFQSEKGIIATDERLDVENARLNELSSQLVVMQSLLAESSSRQTQAGLATSDRMAEVLNNPLIASLKADLARSEVHLQELSSRLGDNHPQVQEAKANLAELRSRVDSETRKVTGGVGVNDKINRQRESDIRAALEAQRSKVLRMKQVRDEGAVIARDVDNAQRAYDLVLSRLSQTNLESQATQSNVNVLTQATPPMLPSFPRLGLNTAISVVVGLLLAAGVVVLLELMDRRIRSVDEIAAVLGLPVLGVMPKPNSRGSRGGKRSSLMQQRLMGSLPAPSRGA